MKCIICDSDPTYTRWTDTHGIGACTNCGMLYTLLHYEPGTNKLLDLPPEPALSKRGIELAKRYWEETGKRVFPGYYDVMGIHPRRGNRTYSGATKEEIDLFEAWYDALPPEQTREES